MDVGLVKHKAFIRLRNMEDFESYLNAICIDYDTGVVIFTGYVCGTNKPQFNKVNRSQYGNGADLKRDIVE